MNATCSTCRFWRATGEGPDVWDPTADDGDGEYVETAHRKCVAIIHGNGFPQPIGAARAPAMVRDGSGYAATFWTLGSFGCSMHEPAPMTEDPHE